MEDSQLQQQTASGEQRGSFFLRTLAPVLFFVVTLFTVLLAGNMLAGKSPFGGQQSLRDFLWTGLPFGGVLILILGAHACGHYVTARKYRVHAWLPYFIPKYTTKKLLPNKIRVL